MIQTWLTQSFTEQLFIIICPVFQVPLFYLYILTYSLSAFKTLIYFFVHNLTICFQRKSTAKLSDRARIFWDLLLDRKKIKIIKMEDRLNELHLFYPFTSSSLPVFSIFSSASLFSQRSCLFYCRLSLYSLSFITPAVYSLFALLSITFTSAAVIPLLPFSISPPLHLDIDLCSIFFSLSSFAPVSLLHHLPLSFAIFLTPPSILHSLHPLGSRALDGKPQRGKRKRWREENNLEEDKDKR